MPRLFLPYSEFKDGVIIIKGEKARYLTSVLRCRNGEFLTVNDDKGKSYSARIITVTAREVTAMIIKKEDSHAESPLNITLLQGLLKGEKMDLIIQKATELGVNRIIPVVSERSQIRETRKLGRWKKIAEEAARQSGRNIVPDVAMAMDFEALFSGAKGLPEKGIIFWEDGGESLLSVIKNFAGCNTICLFTGPEGGFSDREIKTASEKGLAVASLGRRILRAETAAIAALAIVQYALGDIGAC